MDQSVGATNSKLKSQLMYVILMTADQQNKKINKWNRSLHWRIIDYRVQNCRPL